MFTNKPLVSSQKINYCIVFVVNTVAITKLQIQQVV